MKTKKQYVVKINFNQPFSYYARFNEENWEEIYNPSHATVFKTKKAAKEKINETNYEEYMSVSDFDSEVKSFNDWFIKGMQRREFAYINKNISRKYNNESPEEVLDWWFEYFEAQEDEIKYKDYKSWPPLFKIFECLFCVESYYSSDYTEKYTSVIMKVKPNTSFETFKKELNLIKDRIDYLDKDGNKRIHIFDRFLSEGDNYVYFLIKKNGKYAIANKYNEVISGSLEEVFEYWKRERYYEQIY